MRRTLVLTAAVAIVFSGCKAKEAFNQISAARELANKGSVQVMKEAAEDKYDPPADGKLTEAQIQMYLKVREHEKTIAQTAYKQAEQHAEESKKAGDKSLAGMVEGLKTMGSVADMLTADIRAAKDLHYNTQEYLWVKGQVLAASGAAYGEKLQEAASASMDAAYQQMKKSYDEATDPEQKKAYGEMLAGYEKSRQEMQAEKEKQDPAVAYNKQLLTKYDGALNALTTELAKFEKQPGEAQKSMKEFEQNVDKAVQDAKKGQ